MKFGARLVAIALLATIALSASGCEIVRATAQPRVAAAAPAPSAEPTQPPQDVSTPPMWAAGYGGITNGVITNDKVVALTFDDGPTPRTQRIVDQLDAFGAHATFFWVGSRITTDAAQYAMAHGDELANHTWDHPDMRFKDSEEASREIGWTNARIAEFTGLPPIWFRSPYNRLYADEYEQMQAHGLLYANYSITSVDWMKGVSEAKIVSSVLGTLHPGGIVLMHDSPTHDPTYLPALLQALRDRGYRMVTLSDLTQQAAPVDAPLKLGAQVLDYSFDD